ncbi:hypothetical protein Cgig2_002385 [Carnegiea gigantea]|uniref:Uncharacterized protein n=1 Tax=Carnegiea gigantea TaxID=171969 RepID=A0A9Q1KUR5_9CARY|nr:hypothetical protein Cgig2_002385 [Carnegiea gigantea]
MSHNEYAQNIRSLVSSLEPYVPSDMNRLLNCSMVLPRDFGWDKVMEGHNTVGLQQGNQSLALEPRGKLEPTGGPVHRMRSCIKHVPKLVLTFIRLVKAVAGEISIGFTGVGFEPKWGLHDMPIIPKVIPSIISPFRPCLSMYCKQFVDIYEISGDYIRNVGTHGLDDVMFRTCAVQVIASLSLSGGLLSPPKNRTRK